MVNKPFPPLDRLRPETVPPVEAARRTAGRLVDWLLAEPGRLARFMTATGLEPAALRAGLDGDELTLAVLDHLLGDEAELLAATTALGLPPEAPTLARLALGGTPEPHWT